MGELPRARQALPRGTHLELPDFGYDAPFALTGGGPGAAALADSRPPGGQRPRLPDSRVPELSGNLGDTLTYRFNGTVPTSLVSDRETAPPPAASCSTA